MKAFPRTCPTTARYTNTAHFRKHVLENGFFHPPKGQKNHIPYKKTLYNQPFHHKKLNNRLCTNHLSKGVFQQTCVFQQRD